MISLDEEDMQMWQEDPQEYTLMKLSNLFIKNIFQGSSVIVKNIQMYLYNFVLECEGKLSSSNTKVKLLNLKQQFISNYHNYFSQF